MDPEDPSLDIPGRFRLVSSFAIQSKGTITIIDPAFNLYDIITMENCAELVGTYSGLAAKGYDAESNRDTLTYQVDNDSVIMTRVVFQ